MPTRRRRRDFAWTSSLEEQHKKPRLRRNGDSPAQAYHRSGGLLRTRCALARQTSTTSPTTTFTLAFICGCSVHSFTTLLLLPIVLCLRRHDITTTCEICLCLEDRRRLLVPGSLTSLGERRRRIWETTRQKRRIKMRKNQKENGGARDSTRRLASRLWRQLERRKSVPKPNDWTAHDGRAWREEHGVLGVKTTEPGQGSDGCFVSAEPGDWPGRCECSCGTTGLSSPFVGPGVDLGLSFRRWLASSQLPGTFVPFRCSSAVSRSVPVYGYGAVYLLPAGRCYEISGVECVGVVFGW